MSNSRLNIELFKKVRDRIAEIPESFDQGVWVESSAIAPCGAVACLAGETIICSAPSVAEGVAELNHLDAEQGETRDFSLIANRAARLLGLKGDYPKKSDIDMGETVIFRGDVIRWPAKFRRMFFEQGEAKAAVAYLDHIIETGRVLE